MKVDLQFRYDEISDVLYISFGNPRPGYSKELSDGILVRYDFVTKKIIGFTVINYSRQKLE